MCKYCDINKYEENWDGLKVFRLGWDCHTSLDIFYDPNKNKFSIATQGEGGVEIEMDYCFKCGRKLKGNQDESCINRS